MRTAASFAIAATPPASVCNSLSGQLITNIDISVCAQGGREPGRTFPTPTCHYQALQFAPLILCRFLVGCRVKTNSLHSVLKLKSIHLSKQGLLSSFGARPIPEGDSVHLSLVEKVLSAINQSQTIILLHFFSLLFKDDLIRKQEIKFCWYITSESFIQCSLILRSLKVSDLAEHIFSTRLLLESPVLPKTPANIYSAAPCLSCRLQCLKTT